MSPICSLTRHHCHCRRRLGGTMVFLSPATTESAFVFATEDGSDALVLDIKGVYAIIDGGSEPRNFLDCIRSPTAAIVSTAAPSAMTNALRLNEQPESLVAVVANLPSAAALKDSAAAEPIRQLYKTLSVPPVVAQLKGTKPEPLVIHKNLSTGTLSVYTLAGDSKDAEAVAKAYQSGSSETIEAAAAAASSVLLIVWVPAREDAPIKRILHLGSAPLPRIQQALDRARSLPFLQSATASTASLKAKPAAPAAGARPAARVTPTATPTAKPAARVAPATRPAAPTTRAAPSARPSAPVAAAPKPTRASLPARAAPSGAARPTAAAPATRPARASAAPRPTAAPTTRAAGRASTAGGAKEEVAKKTIVGKSTAAASSARATPNGPASKSPSKAAPVSATASPVVPVAAAAAVATTAVVAAAAVSDPSPLVSHQQSEETEHTAAAAPSIHVSIEEPNGEEVTTPGGLPVPASPTIIPATPQPPMSPEPEEEKEPVRESTPEPTPAAAEEEQPTTPVVPSAPLEPAASVDEPEFVKEIVDEQPQPTPAVPSAPLYPELPHEEEPHEDPYKPVEPPVEEPVPTPASVPVEPEPTPASAPADPTPGVGDLLGDFDTPQQQPGDDGLLDSLEEPMKKMQISMDTDKLAEELGLTGGDQTATAGGDESLLDLTQPSIMDTDLDRTQNASVIESAHEFDDLLSPRAETVAEMQRKLSEQAQESLLAAAANDPFIAGLASTVVEAATIDGAKSTLESLMSNNRGVESPTGDKLLSFRSSGFENPDEPKEVKYEETDPAIDDVLTKLADESDMVNGGDNHEVELNGHGDSAPNGHHVVNGNGWPEGTTMHLPPPTGSAKNSARETKFKLTGPIHVDLVSVPHRGKTILLNDEAASIEFFSSVRSSIYVLQSGGEVPVHVLDGWKKGKGAWAANVPSRIVPTHHNETVAKWTHDNGEELNEIGLSVATPVELTTLTYPDGQAKACTLLL